MSEDDLAPVKKAAQAADLSLSAVIRECVVRHGLETAIDLARDREFQATTAYKLKNRRRLPRETTTQRTKLVELVAYKYEITSDLAMRWIRMGRIEVGGEQVLDPGLEVEADLSTIEKAAA
jgi:enolase